MSTQLFSDVLIGMKFFVIDKAAQDVARGVVMEKVTDWQYARSIEWNLVPKPFTPVYFTVASLRVETLEGEATQDDEDYAEAAA